MLQKIEQSLIFNNKRNYKLVTPCCNKSNNDGKFVNYKDYPDQYGYCHSCGIATLPPTIYKNEKGEEFIWDINEEKFIAKYTLNEITINVEINCNNEVINQNYISEEVIWDYFTNEPENNLLQYLRSQYCNEKVQDAKEIYAIGSTLDGGTIFWNINKDLKVQKSKICYYNEIGKRTDKFKVPYKNEDGYFSCLFGEHLLSYENYKDSTVILVESEKTAIVGHILMPQYVWLSFGGCNGLTIDKIDVLKGFRVLLIPDMSENAINIAMKKVIAMRKNGINIKLWDMTESKTDEELKSEGGFNNDLEDIFRKL